MRTLVKYLLIILLLGGITLSIKAQPRRALVEYDYFIQNYTPDDYHGEPQILSIEQDAYGRMLFGNNYGINLYDGHNFTKIAVNGTYCRSILRGAENRIYIGTDLDFGVLDNNERQFPVFTSYDSAALHNSNHPISDVWRIHEKPWGIVFQTFEGIYIHKNGKTNVIHAEGNGYHFSFLANNRIFVKHKDQGLLELTENGLKETINGKEFITVVPTGMVYLPHLKKYLVATKNNGLLLYDEANKTKSLSAFNTEVDQQLTEGFIYKMLQLKDGNILLATFNDGLFILNKRGELVKHLNKSNGLQNNQVFSIFQDQQGNIWAGTGNGISKIEYASPLKKLAEKSQLDPITECFAKLNNHYLAGTREGLYTGQYNGSRIVYTKYPAIPQMVNELVKPNDKHVLVASETGLYLLTLENNTLKEQLLFQGIVNSVTYNASANSIIIGTAEGLYYAQNSTPTFSNNKFIKIEPHTFSTLSLKTFPNGETWAEVADSGMIQLVFKNQLPVTYLYSVKDGLPKRSGNKPFWHQQSVQVLTTNNGMYLFNPSKKKFSQNVSSPALNDLRYAQLWRLTTDKEITYGQIYNHSTENYELGSFGQNTKWNTHILTNVPNKVTYDIRSLEEGMVFSGDKGIFLLNQSNLSNPKLCSPVIDLVVSQGKDTLQYFALDPLKYTPFQLAYKENKIEFNFSLPSYINENATQYSTLLDGLEDKWSSWTDRPEKEYTNLWPGAYTFKVKARDAMGFESLATSYSFVILPPWYLTWWAYFVYLLGAIAVVYGIVQLSVRRLKAAKEKLEAIVKERTAEVVKQKDELQEQKLAIEKINEELAYKNKEITDSIQYAKKIQEAILVDETQIKNSLPGSFIIYLPRDIVSGDFYWFNKIDNNECLIAAADCTGHGVPGAFMSMIGSTLLNEIVNEKQITQPDAILNQLNLDVRTSLKQDDEHSQSRDGMDVALCRINTQNRTLKYAGAMRPLYIIRGNEFEEIKATKNPIGGKQSEEVRNFLLNEFTFEKGTTVYFFSDGYADQFGGEKGKKFMTKRFQELLLTIQHLDMANQQAVITKAFQDWKGTHEQVDDVLVIGVRF